MPRHNNDRSAIGNHPYFGSNSVRYLVISGIGRRLGALLNRPGIAIALANSLSWLGCQMKNGLTVVNAGRQVSRRARAPFPHDAEHLSKRIAVLEQILSILRAELQIAAPNDRSKIGLRRVVLCVRRPIAGRYQTPAESGNRQASSRT